MGSESLLLVTDFASPRGTRAIVVAHTQAKAPLKITMGLCCPASTRVVKMSSSFAAKDRSLVGLCGLAHQTTLLVMERAERDVQNWRLARVVVATEVVAM
jgi:hypothetical protein